jgi:hypothetical protein
VAVTRRDGRAVAGTLVASGDVYTRVGGAPLLLAIVSSYRANAYVYEPDEARLLAKSEAMPALVPQAHEDLRVAAPAGWVLEGTLDRWHLNADPRDDTAPSVLGFTVPPTKASLDNLAQGALSLGSPSEARSVERGTLHDQAGGSGQAWLVAFERASGTKAAVAVIAERAQDGSVRVALLIADERRFRALGGLHFLRAVAKTAARSSAPAAP